MKKITCACGAEFKTHTMDELVEIANLHAKIVHKDQFPQGMPKEDVMRMAKDA